MLTLRSTQLEQLEAPIRRAVRLDVLDRLRRERSELSTERSQALVEHAERRVDAYGGDPRADLARFVFLCIELGERFDEELSWACAVMDDDEVIAASKLDVIEIYRDALRGSDP